MRPVVIFLLPALALAASLAATGGPGAAPRSDALRGGPMPDSVLAWIGSRREVSLTAFREAWRLVAPPSRPDSLTPQGARRFLELLIDREALAEWALREPPEWTAEDSAGMQGLRDQLTLRATLDSTLATTRARLGAAGDTTRDPQAVGVAARESLLARLDPRWDEEGLERLAAAFGDLPRPTADSSVGAQLRMAAALPRCSPADSARVLVTTTAGPYRTGELLAWWARLDPLVRPRIATGAQVRDLAANALFERALRSAATREGLERRPDIAAALARQRELIAVRHLVAREVVGRIALDSATVRRHYDRHTADFGLPLRVRVMRLVLDDRRGATEMALQLRSEASAESLLARAARRRVRYDEELTAARDSALCARALRAGTRRRAGARRDSVGMAGGAGARGAAGAPADPSRRRAHRWRTTGTRARASA